MPTSARTPAHASPADGSGADRDLGDHGGRGQDDHGGRLGLTAVALLVGGMACFGSATPVSQIVGRSFPVWLGSALRMAVAAAVLCPPAVLALRRQGTGPLRLARGTTATDRWLFAGIAVIGTFGFSALMLLGMREAPGAVGAVVMATTPAVTAMGAVAFLGERLGHRRLIAVALALAGVALVNLGADTAQGGGDRVVLGSALVFGAVLCEATYSLMGKRLTSDVTPVVISAAAATLAGVAFLPLAVWDAWAFPWSAPTLGQWVAVAWWGAGTMGLGSWLWFRGMQRVAAGTASAFMGVMPVSALVLSYVLLGEAFQWIHVGGLALVLVGLAVVVRSDADLH